MVLGILVAVAAGIAICHAHHKRQRMNLYKQYYAAEHGALTKEEWKQLCKDHKQARKADKQARKAEKHMRRAERRAGRCWRTSLPALPAPGGAAPANHGPDVKYAKGDVFTTFPASQGQRQIPVQGPDEPPAYVAAPMEKM